MEKNNMSKPIKCIYYAIVLFGNMIINKIPSRHLRKGFYKLLEKYEPNYKEYEQILKKLFIK